MVRIRALATGIFRFVLVTLLTCLLLIGTTLLIAFALAWVSGEEWQDPRYLATGLVCGMITWLFVAIFHLRGETQTMPFSQREQFIAKTKTVLLEMGYALTAAQGDSLFFRPRFHSYLFGGGIHVSLSEHEAKIIGPKVSLEIFRRCFRLLNHVQRVQLYLQEHRKVTDNIIKRVELRLRLRPEQLEAVRKNVIAVLQQDGDVVCELSLLVTSENGVRENKLESHIREWLQQQGIDCDIHKDLVQFVEVVHPELEPA